MLARGRYLLPQLGAVLAALVLATIQGGPSATAAEVTAPELPSTAGEELWLRDCAVCHGDDGNGSDRGPSLQGSGPAGVDLMVTTGRMPIDEPREEASPGPVNYDPAEIAALVEYAATIIAGPEVPEVDIEGADLAKGGEAYRTDCASCHQMAGQGGILPDGRNVPSLGSSNEVQVVEAIRSGPNSMPNFPTEVIDEETATQIAAYLHEIDAPRDRGGWSIGHWGPVPEGAIAFALGLLPVVLVARLLGDRNPPPEQEDEIR